MRRRSITAALVAGLALAPTLSGQGTDPAMLAIVGGTLLDGTGAAQKPGMTILVKDGRIDRIGPAASTPVPPGARTIRAEGKFVLPGFIDAHVHYRDYYPELLITHGITSVADWGGSPVEWILAQRDGIAHGKIYGPRIYTSGQTIGENRGEAATLEGAVAQVRDLAARGVDRIDVGYDVSPEVIGAVVREAHSRGLSVSGYPLRAREAIEAGLDAIKHTHTLGRASTDAAGIKILTNDLAITERRRNVHPCVLDGNADALMRLMVEKKTTWVPTLVKDFKAVLDRRDEFERDNINLLGNPDLQYLPLQDLLPQLTNVSDEGLMQTPCGMIGTYDKSSPDYALFQRSYKQLQTFIRTFVQSGGRVLAGTAPHSFVLPGISLHHEMELFVDAGLTPMQALQTASRWPAEWMNAQTDIGTIETGKFADIVVLTKNPLLDIRNTRTVETVVQGGRGAYGWMSVLKGTFGQFLYGSIVRN
jgi:hypothetical protein